MTCYHLGIVAFGQGDPDQSVEYLEEALRLGRAIGETFVTGWTIDRLGIVVCEQGDYARAATALVESLTLVRAGNDRVGLANRLALAAVIATGYGRSESAARLFGAAETESSATGVPFQLPERTTYEPAEAAARAALSAEAFAAAWETGRHLTTDRAVAEALEVASSVGEGVPSASSAAQ